MGWEFELAITGNLQKYMDAEVRAGKRAVTSTIRRRTTSLKNRLRKNLTKALKNPSDRLRNTVRGDTYPARGNSLNAAGIVFSKAIVKRPGGPVDLLQAFDEGSLITPWGHRFIAIHNPRVIPSGTGFKGSPKSRSPRDFPANSFILKYTKKANVAMLVLRRDPTKVAFWLFKVIVQKPKKINIDAEYARAISGMDTEVARKWERNSQRQQTRFDVNR